MANFILQLSLRHSVKAQVDADLQFNANEA
jgi:hypothetical protein